MALYHTYRPTTFDDVAYQAHIIDTIKSQVIHEKVGHAYLFAGPRGVGKTTTARILAKAVNLPLKDGTAEFDNSSAAAKEIDGSRSIDVIEIDAASNTGVDNVREHIIENARFQPTSLKKKVFIIDEVHMLSNSAFNALLKTLEEPPAHVMFILATTELHKIPETIISRCQVFRFKRVPFEPMKAHLESILKQEKVKVDDDVLARVINKSDGCVRDAMSLLEQILATGETHITKDNVTMLLPTSDVSTTLAFLATLVEKNMQQGLAAIQGASADGVRMEQFAHDTLELLRILMIVKATNDFSGTGIDLSDSAKHELTSLTAHISHGELVTLADLIMTRKQQIPTSPIPEMPMEMVVVEWCGDKVPEVSNVGKVSKVAEVPAKPLQAEPKPVQKTEHTTSPETEMAEMDSIQTEETTEDRKPTTTEETVVRPPSSVGEVQPIDEKAVKTHWNAWIKMIEADSPTMVFILKMATLKEIVGNTIAMSVEYTFHRDKLMNPETKRKLEIAFGQLLGSAIAIDVEVEKSTQGGSDSEQNAANNELTDLTAAFGGQVV
ncbi:MAG: polymerase III, subunit gamma and tau protein [Candidatus Magasanikbacteria bacterium GW2011_GWD2_43_18]|uniref:DNA polymerase III subunit gamma/tau n=1 Tax=Candidatus Magasanikbacteria bacterium GW2011_GWE2_42_7 TaxID=1619052 RepID=A0A0G1BCW7_9BACT|nr:MAG: polymerase III, subunit gamma and tau protein [Candidatus Magasanikbacteria bacterium GW2011_GWE2_42_7]KKT04574.1 MAG: polymerase III, subunit gamma and tau protein [Candidatus Magasanikbacteria bacterium GW2011_GWD2_43_18]KKT25048.1 MAG: polymerase III, subunit gamma and tau protein [Candidatus Magasanikbacteria bacterium GW2011_GWA2_43_9]HCC13726.1 DNA polymerase III subunit gamma/tau [Candidatus Magasanikbacteria bacterium]